MRCRAFSGNHMTIRLIGPMLCGGLLLLTTSAFGEVICGPNGCIRTLPQKQESKEPPPKQLSKPRPGALQPQGDVGLSSASLKKGAPNPVQYPTNTSDRMGGG